VLILARDEVIAALVGLLIELEEFEPTFAEPGERPEDAVARVRPPLVIAIDCELDVAQSDLFFVRASQGNAAIVLFSCPDAAVDLEALARARAVPWFRLPVDRADIATALARALETTAT
jgi:hypothetical protein